MAEQSRTLAPQPEPLAFETTRYRVIRRTASTFAGRLGGFLILSLTAIAIMAPVIAPGGYATPDLSNMLQPPFWMEGGDWSHPLGTDNLGRDVASRVVWAGRVSLSVAALAVGAATTVGVTLGLLAGYFGGPVDAVVMRVADVQLAFPYLLLAIAVIALLGPSIVNLIILLALPGWMVYARLVRGVVLSLRECEFVVAAITIGSPHYRVIMRHLLPNIVAPVVIVTSFQVAQTIILEASLSFLGVGVPPPTPSWGSMLGQGRQYFTTAWWLGVFPGLAVTLAVVGTNLLGDGLRDALDPRLKL